MPVERHEVGAVFFGGRGDQGVREAGAVARSEVSPVETTEPRYFPGNGQDAESQEKLLERPLFRIAFDAGEQLGEVGREAFEVFPLPSADLGGTR